MEAVGQYLFILIMACSIFKSEAVVTKNQSLCPIPKTSPRQRQASTSSSSPVHSADDTTWQEPRPRTLDLIYGLLTPGRPQRQLELDDCGKSEDFGEKDSGSGLIKPVTEDILDLPQPHYRPIVIGGRLAYIVGFASRKPPTEDTPTKGPPTEDTSTKGPPTEDPFEDGNKESNAPIQFPSNVLNKSSQEKLQEVKSKSIIGSFVDMLFN